MIPSGTPVDQKRQQGRRAETGVGPAADSLDGLIHSARHLDGAKLAYVDGHVKWRHYIGGMTIVPATTTLGDKGPPRDGIDYDNDGTLGNGGNWD